MTANMSMGPQLKKWARQIHLYTALVLCIPLALLGLTGSILVYDDEIQSLANPDSQIRASASGPAASLDRLITAAQASAPNNARASSLTLPNEAGLPVSVGFGAGRGATQVFVDPVSAEILGTRSGPPRQPGLMLNIFLLHGNLLNFAGGRDTVGWLGIAMCLLGVTGLVLWWPRRGSGLRAFTVTRGISGRRLLSELHGATGIWSLTIFMIVSFSGVYLAFPRETATAIRAVFPTQEVTSAARALRVSADGRTAVSLDRVAEIARAAAPEDILRTIALPVQPDQPYRVSFIPHGLVVDGGPAVTVYVDPYEAGVLAVLDPRTYPLTEKFILWQRPWHEGEGLGPVFRFLVFLSGLLPPFFLVTGIWMWLLRRKRRVKAPV